MTISHKIAIALDSKAFGSMSVVSVVPLLRMTGVVVNHRYPTNSAALSALLASPAVTASLQLVNRRFGSFDLTLVDAGPGLRVRVEVRAGVLFLKGRLADDDRGGSDPAAKSA